LRRQRVGATLFLPLTIHRLRGDRSVRSAEFVVTLQDILEESTVQRNLRILWETDAPALPPAVQEKIITEWAALGIACAVVDTFLGLTLRAVAAEGDRFDYWLNDGNTDLGLEVSGTITESVEARHREKVAQLRANPYGVDGYVVVVGFTTREILCSFHRFQDR